MLRRYGIVALALLVIWAALPTATRALTPAQQTILFNGPSCPTFANLLGFGCATNWADYTREGNPGAYGNSGVTYNNAAAWWASRGTGSTFARSTNGTGVISSGLISTFGTNVARYVYDPSSLKALGRLYEGSRTNVALQSGPLSGGSWTSVNLATTSSQPDPAGGSSGTLLVPSAANTNHVLFQQLTTSASVFSWSIIAKPAGYNFLQLEAVTSSSVRYAVVFNLTTGAVTQTTTANSPTATSASSKILNNGWVLLQIQMTATSNAGGTYFVICPTPTGTPTQNGSLDPVFTGDGVSGATVWNAQLEAGTFASSQIATTTGAVTRGADSQSLTRTAPTSITKVIAGRTPPDSNPDNLRAWHIDDTTANNRLDVYYDGSHLVFFLNNSGSGVSLGTAAISPNTDFVIALRAATNNFAWSVNGGSVGTDTSHSLPSSLTREIEGAYSSAGFEWFSTIKGTAEFTNYAASNQALQALSGSSYWAANDNHPDTTFAANDNAPLFRGEVARPKLWAAR